MDEVIMAEDACIGMPDRPKSLAGMSLIMLEAQSFAFVRHETVTLPAIRHPPLSMITETSAHRASNCIGWIAESSSLIRRRVYVAADQAAIEGVRF